MNILLICFQLGKLKDVIKAVCTQHSDAKLTRRNTLLREGTKLQNPSPLEASGYWDYLDHRDKNGDYLPKQRQQLSGVLHHLKLSPSPTPVLLFRGLLSETQTMTIIASPSEEWKCSTVEASTRRQ